jgi:hypothetical protein
MITAATTTSRCWQLVCPILLTALSPFGLILLTATTTGPFILLLFGLSCRDRRRKEINSLGFLLGFRVFISITPTIFIEGGWLNPTAGTAAQLLVFLCRIGLGDANFTLGRRIHVLVSEPGKTTAERDGRDQAQ